MKKPTPSQNSVSPKGGVPVGQGFQIDPESFKKTREEYANSQKLPIPVEFPVKD